MKKYICLILFLVLCFAPEANAKNWKNEQVICHAFGTYKGQRRTHSKEAWAQAMKKKYTLIEIDACYTTDGILVLSHSAPGTYEEWLDQQGKYRSWTMQEFLAAFAKTKNVWIVLDVKRVSPARICQDIYALCDEMGCPKLCSRIIPQIYFQNELADVKAVYPFPDIIYSAYKGQWTKDKDYKQAAAFCQKNKISVVTIPVKQLTKKRVAYFTKKRYGSIPIQLIVYPDLKRLKN